MNIAFDPAKLRTTLERRGLDMARAGEIFDGDVLTVADERLDYCEPRFITSAVSTGAWSFWSGRRATVTGASSA